MQVQIKLIFHDPLLKPVCFVSVSAVVANKRRFCQMTLMHLLKLYPNEETVQVGNILVSEHYDELVWRLHFLFPCCMLVGGERKQNPAFCFYLILFLLYKKKSLFFIAFVVFSLSFVTHSHIHLRTRVHTQRTREICYLTQPKPN